MLAVIPLDDLNHKYQIWIYHSIRPAATDFSCSGHRSSSSSVFSPCFPSSKMATEIISDLQWTVDVCRTRCMSGKVNELPPQCYLFKLHSRKHIKTDFTYELFWLVDCSEYFRIYFISFFYIPKLCFVTFLYLQPKLPDRKNLEA